jgi:hypothetical protein
MRHQQQCSDPFESRLAVEYWYGSPWHYDGVSEWRCSHGRFGRWCGQKLEGNEAEPPFCNEVEPPFCKGEVHPQVAVQEEG